MVCNFTRAPRCSPTKSDRPLVPATGHSAESDTDLLKAYRSAIYQVRLPGGRRVSLVPGKVLPAVLGSLCADDDTPCALITAWNPYSQRTSRHRNRLAMRSLCQQLRQLESQYCLPALSRAADGNWREVQLFVVGVAINELDRLAHNFGQEAILFGTPAKILTIRHYSETCSAGLNEKIYPSIR